ncbi:hypothetical protein KA078_03345 [Candidatus Woesebacteria bacterium]|nr:hypothetical protein [Candidatus Woesebacteria bacterium]
MQPYPDELFFGTLFFLVLPIVGSLIIGIATFFIGRYLLNTYLPAHSDWRLKSFLMSGVIGLIFWALSEKLDTDAPSYVMLLIPRFIIIPISIVVNVVSFVLIVSKFFAQKIEGRKK